MGSSLTDASKRAKMGAGADTYNNVFIAEYNNTGGLIGNAGQDHVKAADGFNAAHQKTYGLYKDSLSNTSNKSANEAVLGMFKEIKSVSDYVTSGSHGVETMTRDQCRDTKLESVLTDNEGGISKLSMGMLSMALIKAKVVTYMSRLVVNNGYKLDEFANKSKEAYTDAKEAVASKNIGVYSKKEHQENITVKLCNLGPVANMETGEEHNINIRPGKKQCSVSNVYTKTTNKYKKLNGILQPADERSNMCGGGIAYCGDTAILTTRQATSLRKTIGYVLTRRFPGFVVKKHKKAIDSLLRDPAFALPMSQFSASALEAATWENLVSIYICGLLLTTNNYLAKPPAKANNPYDGFLIPKFGQLKGAAEVTIEPMSHALFGRNPRLVYARTKVTVFTAKSGTASAQKYVSCTLGQVHNMNQFMGHAYLYTVNQDISGVFVPLKKTFNGGGDDNSLRADNLSGEIQGLFGMSTHEKCCAIQRHAHSYLEKARDIYNLSEGSEVSFGQLLEVFGMYDPALLLDDADVKELVECLSNRAQMAEVCARVLKKEEEEGNEDDDTIDFSTIMMSSTTSTKDTKGNGVGPTEDLMDEFRA